MYHPVTCRYVHVLDGTWKHRINTAKLTAKTPPLKVGAWNCLPLKIGIPRVTEKVYQPSIYRGELAVTFTESTLYPPFVCFSWCNLIPTSLTSSQHLPGSSTLPKNNPPDHQPTHHFLRHFFLFKTWPTKTHTQKRRAQKTFPYPTGSRTCRPCFPHLPPLGGWTSTSRWPTLCHRAGLQGQHGREDEIRKKLFCFGWSLNMNILNPRTKVWFRWFSCKQVIFRFHPLVVQGVWRFSVFFFGPSSWREKVVLVFFWKIGEKGTLENWQKGLSKNEAARNRSVKTSPLVLW